MAVAGFAPLFSTALIHVTDSPNAPAFYLIDCGLVSLIGLAAVPETHELAAAQVEAGILDRTSTDRRKFRRLTPDEIAAALGG